MVLTKLILQTINENHNIDCQDLYLKMDDAKATERLAFLCENGYVQQVNNKFTITERGRQIINKLL